MYARFARYLKGPLLAAVAVVGNERRQHMGNGSKHASFATGLAMYRFGAGCCADELGGSATQVVGTQKQQKKTRPVPMNTG